MKTWHTTSQLAFVWEMRRVSRNAKKWITFFFIIEGPQKANISDTRRRRVWKPGTGMWNMRLARSFFLSLKFSSTTVCYLSLRDGEASKVAWGYTNLDSQKLIADAQIWRVINLVSPVFERWWWGSQCSLLLPRCQLGRACWSCGC